MRQNFKRGSFFLHLILKIGLLVIVIVQVLHLFVCNLVNFVSWLSPYLRTRFHFQGKVEHFGVYSQWYLTPLLLLKCERWVQDLLGVVALSWYVFIEKKLWLNHYSIIYKLVPYIVVCVCFMNPWCCEPMDMFNNYYALPKFSSKNYDIWAIKMRTRLHMDDLWDIMLNRFEEPQIKKPMKP
jgi:hypothetical protein